MERYLSMYSKRSPQEIWEEVNKTGECPWVRIGNLYASVSFTGNESWVPVVQDLYRLGQRNFTVLAGRHGDQLGQKLIVSEGKRIFAPRDPEAAQDAAIDPMGDEREAQALRRAYKDIELQVYDVGAQKDTRELQISIATQLTAGNVVLLAWCYSLYAMKPGWDEDTMKSRPELWVVSNSLPISKAACDWHWVLRYPTSAASNSLGSRLLEKTNAGSRSGP